MAAVLASNPGREWYVTELAERLGSHSGGVTQLLQRLQQLGWVLDRWEADERTGRHYYRVNTAELSEIDAALRQAADRVEPLMAWSAARCGGEGEIPISLMRSRVATMSALEVVDLISDGLGELRRRVT